MEKKTLNLSKTRLLIAVLLLTAIVLSLAPFQPALADAPEGLDPNTIVSNDGQVFMAPAAAESAAVPFAGRSMLSVQGTMDQSASPERFGQPLGGGGAESVIGPDGRTRITTTTVYPYRAIVFLKITWKNNSQGWCTGWLIGERTVATAGHCVYSHDTATAGWFKSIVAYAGKNGTSNPYGSATSHRAWTVTGWTSGSGSANYDYAAVQLNNRSGTTHGFGYYVGWFGFVVNQYLNQSEKIYGYPGDKTTGTMWGMGGTVKQLATRRIYYNNDTYGGQSGSPVYITYQNQCCYGIAIHAYGVGSSSWNSGTRIVTAVYNNLVTWKYYTYP